MFYFVFALLCFLLAVTFHIIFCRQTVTAGLQSKAFIFMAGAFFGVYVVGSLVISHGGWINPETFWGLPFIFTSGFVYILGIYWML
jgi:hypothetical protein